MTTLSSLTFDGGTDGASVSESGWSTPAIPLKYDNAQSFLGGMSAFAAAGVYGSNGRNVTGLTEWRIRTYVRRNGTATGHAALFYLTTGTYAGTSPADNTYGGDVQIRNTGGGLLACRWNYDSSSIAATAFPTDTWVRMDLHWSSAAGMTLYVYEAADDTTVDYTLSDADAAGAAITGLWIGKEITTSLNVWHDEVLLTDGPDPGPAVPPVTDSATYDLTATYTTDTTTIASWALDATASVGTVTLTQTSGTTASVSESPTGVFTITNPAGTDSLVFDLDAGTDTLEVTITRAAASERPAIYTKTAAGWF